MVGPEIPDITAALSAAISADGLFLSALVDVDNVSHASESLLSSLRLETRRSFECLCRRHGYLGRGI